MQQKMVAGIPVEWVKPPSRSERKLVIWLHGFTESREDIVENLHDLAVAGFVALSFDSVDHGQRSRYPNEQQSIDSADGSFVAETDGKLYRHFWSIEAETAVAMPTLIDWAIAELGVASQVGIGGKSMGGDIALVAAGLDERITAVAACIATPDWLKPGSMYELSAPNAMIQAQYDRYNPLTNLHHYQICPAMLMQCGAVDPMVPASGTLRFAQTLAATYQHCPDKLKVRVEQGVAHEMTESMWRHALAWFHRYL